MYPNPSATGQWTPNGPPPTSQPPPPQAWSPQPQTNGQYPPRAPSQNPNQIRCSGFDQSTDGRCTNCTRFSQECIFTPVSAQTQAFVSATALNRYQNGGALPPQQLYGAYGQPIHPQHHQADPYAQPPHQYPPPPNGQYPQGPYPQQQGPPPPGAPQQQPYPPQGEGQQSQAGSPVPPPMAGQKRPTEEPHTPTLPPPNPAAPQVHRSSTTDSGHYSYPDPTSLTPGTATAHSPASSTASYHSAQPPNQPYYNSNPPPQPRRQSPQGYPNPYDVARNSTSPHAGHVGVGAPFGGATSAPGSAHAPTSQGPPPQHQQQGQNGTARQGVRINELVGPHPGAKSPKEAAVKVEEGIKLEREAMAREEERGRSAADSDMLNQLNKRM
ncbi:hypothetical protein M8818_003545 [Zalaria obscura]|uniref:Uncharacterized protein n=1 Tax=Zalaria obscura TaxID=2024903 RepID=A0ACC3SIX6_9PEZI